jgi:uncharacterized RDD family membrane protein YckC
MTLNRQPTTVNRQPKKETYLPRQVLINTPENVTIEYELAGVASRCSAAVVDLLIQAAAIFVAIGAYLVLQYYMHFPDPGWITSALVILLFVLWWGYYVYFETKWNGQTPGKRSHRMRVITSEGAPITLTSAAVRGLIRAVDLNLIGILSILVTSRNQRLGDLAAGTIVVMENVEWKGHLTTSHISNHEYPADNPPVKNIELVTPEQFQAAKRFVERAPELETGIREALAAKIAKPMMQQLGIEDRGDVSYADILTAIHDGCVNNRGMR